MSYFELRFYSSGWRISFGPVYARWHDQSVISNGTKVTSYKELTVGRIHSRDFANIGGMTFREWRLAKRQQKEAREAARKTVPIAIDA